MNIKNAMIFLALIFMLVGSGISQTATHYSDDRELFIGVSGGVMPNIMILADNSISMRTAIYHPDFFPTLYYNHSDPADPSSPAVTLDFGGIFGTWLGYRTLSTTKTFNICGEKGTYVLNGAYQARFIDREHNNPRRWNIEAISGTWTAANVVGKTVYWGCTNTPNSCTKSVTITAVYSTSPLIITVNPRVDPPENSMIYIDPSWELSENPNAARFVAEGTSCGEGETLATNVKLYGTATDTSVLYDDNYLYWLAFHASDTAIAEVTHWATTGAFKTDSSGSDVYAGHYRMKVLQDVLDDVITSLWTKNNAYNFGLASFRSDSEGAEILNNMQNATNLQGSLKVFRDSIASLRPITMTPLAEALADLWAYFKCGQSCTNYMPESETNIGGCGTYSGTSGHPSINCPIQDYCQHSYVIIMTDGQSTDDDFSASKYSNAIFRQPVSTWGDGDNHDPATYGAAQPTTFTPPYCPQQTCWIPSFDGTDYLDDVAYYLYHNDIFPDAIRPDMQDKQCLETFTIGFSIDNQLLKDTAKNGNGEYYTANDYNALKDALTSAITNIMMRNFAFASYTAPKKVTTAVGEGATFVGYFMPSSEEVWDGHLQSYTMNDKWYADDDGDNVLSEDEQNATPYALQSTCQSITGKSCLQTISMAPTPNWDAADKLAGLTSDRKLYTLDYSGGTPVLLDFTAAASLDTLQGPFGFDLPEDDPFSATPTLYHDQAQTIVNKISSKLNFGDIFHSDLAYVGAPLRGKLYLWNYSPTLECNPAALDGDGNPTDADCYEKFRLDHIDRRKVIYVGTNTGIIHMIDANTPDSAVPASADGGKEIWGFIPDEVLPSLKAIAIDEKFTYTTDGRLIADDVYCHGFTTDPWRTILAFGLKDGGKSFYALDITNVQDSPTFFWKFNDATYSGNSWSKPIIGKIRYSDGTSSYDCWVVIVSGGLAYNNENLDDNKGKAVFVLDAASGDVIWMVGYDSGSGAADVSSTTELDVNKSAYGSSGRMHLTKDAAFNYCIPSAINAVDKDNNGYIDTIYFGNVAGHMFKTETTDVVPNNWKTYSLYKTDLSSNTAAGTINNIIVGTSANSYKLTVTTGTFQVGHNVMGATSKAMGFIYDITGTGGNKEYWIQETSAESFQLNEAIVVKPFDPIFLSPAVYKDTCMHYWVNFGTGDRLRSRTNPTSGKFVSLMDGSTTPCGLTLDNLVPLTFSSATGTFTGSTTINEAGKYGWYFNFPDTANFEKLFDPDPIILPDKNFLPHIYFNTYQTYDADTTLSPECGAPTSGVMHFYEITVDYCKGGTASGYREIGRISGGGMMEGSEFIMIEGGGEVGGVDLPGLGSPPKLLPKPLPYTGGLLFLKEKKR